MTALFFGEIDCWGDVFLGRWIVWRLISGMLVFGDVVFGGMLIFLPGFVFGNVDLLLVRLIVWEC